MNVKVIALSLFASLPTLAHASIKELPGVGRDDIKAIERVERDCTYSMMSRMGPRPAEVARCEAAMEVATARGVGAARYALTRIAKSEELGSNRTYLFQVIARVGDLGQVAALVKLLPEQTEAYQRFQIVAALQAITHADPKGTPAIAWQKWLEDHDLTQVTRADLLVERVAQMRTEAANEELGYAIPAARWLSLQPSTRDEGLVALRALLTHPKLDAKQRRNIDYMLTGVTGKKPSLPTSLPNKQALLDLDL